MTTYEYPRSPAGLVWDETMTDQMYYAILACYRAGPALKRVTPEQARIDLPAKRKHVRKSPEERRPYASKYVGVTVRRGRWVAQWGPRGRTICRVFTSAPEDEIKAAWARANALGLSELEVRG